MATNTPHSHPWEALTDELTVEGQTTLISIDPLPNKECGLLSVAKSVLVELLMSNIHIVISMYNTPPSPTEYSVIILKMGPEIKNTYWDVCDYFITYNAVRSVLH